MKTIVKIWKYIHTTVIWEIFVVKKFSYSSKITKIKRTKYFQRTYYVIERELIYRRAQKIFNTNILHTNTFDTKISKLRYNACLLFRWLHHFIAMFCLSFTCSSQVIYNYVTYAYWLPKHAQIINSLPPHSPLSWELKSSMLTWPRPYTPKDHTPIPPKLELRFHNPKYEFCRLIVSFPCSPVVQSSSPVQWSSPLFSDSPGGELWSL